MGLSPAHADFYAAYAAFWRFAPESALIVLIFDPGWPHVLF